MKQATEQLMEQYNHHLTMLIKRVQKVCAGLPRDQAIAEAKKAANEFIEEVKLRDLPKPEISLTNRSDLGPDCYKLMVSSDPEHWSGEILSAAYVEPFCIVTINIEVPEQP
jgi:hypothetical protein